MLGVRAAYVTLFPPVSEDTDANKQAARPNAQDRQCLGAIEVAHQAPYLPIITPQIHHGPLMAHPSLVAHGLSYQPYLA
jgi:hypothetical protein